MKHAVGPLLVRAFLYLLFVAGLAQLVTLEGYRELSASEYAETSLTEWLQAVGALLGSVFFLAVARIDRELRPMAAMLAALTLMMFIREADYFLDARVFDGAWQLLVTIVLIAVTVYLWRQPDSIGDAVAAYARQPSAGILLSGILVTFVFSRLFGRASFWEAVMGEGYMRVVKNIAEEGTELMGYGLIVISAAELFWVCFAGRFTASRS